MTVRVGFQLESYTVGEEEEQLSITIDVETVENDEPGRNTGIHLFYAIRPGIQNPGI